MSSSVESEVEESSLSSAAARNDEESSGREPRAAPGHRRPYQRRRGGGWHVRDNYSGSTDTSEYSNLSNELSEASEEYSYSSSEDSFIDDGPQEPDPEDLYEESDSVSELESIEDERRPLAAPGIANFHFFMRGARAIRRHREPVPLDITGGEPLPKRQRREAQLQIEDVETDHEPIQCIVCLTNRRNICLPCQHFVMCHSCVTRLPRNRRLCPVCRDPIAGFKVCLFS